MRGMITGQGAWEGGPPYFADVLTLARLRILQRQGRIQEYIHLAEAEGQQSLFVNMLARSGQVARAVAEAQQTISVPSEILALAQVLYEQGEPGAALRVATHGLDLTITTGLRELAPDNTGLILAPSHRMMSDIPMANVDALLAVFASLDEKSETA